MCTDQPEPAVSALRVTEARAITGKEGELELEVAVDIPAEEEPPEVLTLEFALHDDVDIGWWDVCAQS